MRTCTDCLHYEVCEFLENVTGIPNDMTVTDCAFFKDKSRFVELPCKVRDTVWLIPRYGGKPLGVIQQDNVQMIGITSRSIHIKARDHHDHNQTHILGRTAFLTREAAEEAILCSMLSAHTVKSFRGERKALNEYL